MYAVECGYHCCVSALLEAGASVDCRVGIFPNVRTLSARMFYISIEILKLTGSGLRKNHLYSKYDVNYQILYRTVMERQVFISLPPVATLVVFNCFLIAVIKLTVLIAMAGLPYFTLTLRLKRAVFFPL